MGPQKVTYHFSEGEWEGHRVMVKCDGQWAPPCPVNAHMLEVMTDFQGEPSGFLTCERCFGVALDPSYGDKEQG